MHFYGVIHLSLSFLPLLRAAIGACRHYSLMSHHLSPASLFPSYASIFSFPYFHIVLPPIRKHAFFPPLLLTSVEHKFRSKVYRSNRWLYKYKLKKIKKTSTLKQKAGSETMRQQRKRLHCFQRKSVFLPGIIRVRLILSVVRAHLCAGAMDTM